MKVAGSAAAARTMRRPWEARKLRHVVTDAALSDLAVWRDVVAVGPVMNALAAATAATSGDDGDLGCGRPVALPLDTTLEAVASLSWTGRLRRRYSAGRSPRWWHRLPLRGGYRGERLKS